MNRPESAERAPALVMLSGNVQRHLLVALARHCKSLRTNGIPVPAELAALVNALAVPSGPQRTGLGAQHQLADPVNVNYSEAARRLGVSARTVRRMISAGQLPVVAIGRRRLVPVSALRMESA